MIKNCLDKKCITTKKGIALQSLALSLRLITYYYILSAVHECDQTRNNLNQGVICSLQFMFTASNDVLALNVLELKHHCSQSRVVSYYMLSPVHKGGQTRNKRLFCFVRTEQNSNSPSMPDGRNFGNFARIRIPQKKTSLSIMMLP